MGASIPIERCRLLLLRPGQLAESQGDERQGHHGRDGDDDRILRERVLHDGLEIHMISFSAEAGCRIHAWVWYCTVFTEHIGRQAGGVLVRRPRRLIYRSAGVGS